MSVSHTGRILDLLRTRAHEPDVIATCRIAWALMFSDHPLKGYREISRESGVSDRIVKRILPSEGETDPLGLITCIDQGQASIHADELRAARYALAHDAGDPGTGYPSYLSSGSYRSPDQEEGLSCRPGPEEALNPLDGLPGVSSTRVAQPFSLPVMQALRPGVDVWHEAGEWAWALAVLTGCSDSEISLGELRDWTRMSPSGVQKMVRRWEESEHHIGYRRATPGRPTVVRLMLCTWVLADPGWYADRTHIRDAFQRHSAETQRHRHRMTDEGYRAKSIVRGEITDHDVPAEVVAEGEDAVYRYLTEPISAPQSAQEPVTLPEVPPTPAEASVFGREDGEMDLSEYIARSQQRTLAEMERREAKRRAEQERRAKALEADRLRNSELARQRERKLEEWRRESDERIRRQEEGRADLMRRFRERARQAA